MSYSSFYYIFPHSLSLSLPPSLCLPSLLLSFLFKSSSFYLSIYLSIIYLYLIWSKSRSSKGKSVSIAVLFWLEKLYASMIRVICSSPNSFCLLCLFMLFCFPWIISIRAPPYKKPTNTTGDSSNTIFSTNHFLRVKILEMTFDQGSTGSELCFGEITLTWVWDHCKIKK